MIAAGSLIFSGALTSAYALDHKEDKATAAADLIIFTHGDTKLAQFDKDGNALGGATDVLRCAGERANVKYKLVYAPLSRAGGIINTMQHAVWFPSGMSDDPERRARMIGPVGVVDFVWYQRKNNARDTFSEDFKNNALVTAYKGSAFEGKLRREGYRWTEGSADHNRLMSMVLSEQVDALLAVDFTFKLDNRMKRVLDESIEMTLYDSIPVYFQVSQFIVDNQPALLERLRSAVATCTP